MTRPRRTYTLVPQRSLGAGWLPCEPHQADRWAVREDVEWTTGGRRAQRSRIVFHSPMRYVAEDERATLTRRQRPLSKPRLGGRFPRRGQTVIAESLTLEQWRNRP